MFSVGCCVATIHEQLTLFVIYYWMSQVARAAPELSRIKERTIAKFQHIHRNTSLIKPSGLIPSSIHFNADKEAGECGVFSLVGVRPAGGQNPF